MDEFDFLDEETTGTEPRGEFMITDDKMADWAVRKIAGLDAEYNRLREIAEAEIQEIQARLQGFREKHDRETSFFHSMLAVYFETTPPESRKTAKTQQSYQLLSGKLVRKLGGFKTEYADADLVRYLRESGRDDYVQVVEKPAWGEFKKRLKITEAGAFDEETGEMLEFVHVEKQPDKFEVKVG